MSPFKTSKLHYSAYGVGKDRKIYGNCEVVWNDILMFRCEKKRADWYLKTMDKETGEPIGELISTDPYTVRLKFKPNGLGNHGKEWGLIEMDNKCVCCGETEYLTRHHVVPQCYRKYLPLNIKSHNFHDVLPLCIPCHENYERVADDLKIKLSNEYDAPLNGERINNKDMIKYTKIAIILSNSNKNIPKSSIKKMRKELRNGLGITRLTKDKIKEISETKISVIKKTHGEIVMSKVNDYQQFMEMWRTHFVENNNCQFLPKNWNVKHESEKTS